MSVPTKEALSHAKSWLCEWERGAETKPEDVAWFALALDNFAQSARAEATFDEEIEAMVARAQAGYDVLVVHAS